MEILEILHTLRPVNIASLTHVLVYLPLCLLVFYCVGRRLRPLVLLAGSLGFFALVEIRYLFLACAVTAVNYALAEQGARLCAGRFRKPLLRLCVLFDLGLIAYSGVMSISYASVFPLGVVIMGLSGVEVALESLRDETPKPRGIVGFSLYMLFFPRLYAGPLITADSFYTSVSDLKFDKNGVLFGFGLLSGGLLKFAAIGRGLFLLYFSVKSVPAGEMSALSSWILVLSFALSVYFSLSGLADIARGIAGLFGFSMPQNFYYPYQSRSVTDFFGRFNMTFSSYLNRNIPALPILQTRAALADALSILFTGCLWGLWFGIQPNRAAWGAVIAVFIIMEKYLYPNALERLPTLFRRIYAFTAVLFSFTILAFDSFAESFTCLRRMVGLGVTDFSNGRALYMLSSNWVLLVFAVVLATNLFSLILSAARKNFPRASSVAFAAADVCVMVAFLSLTLGGDVT